MCPAYHGADDTSSQAARTDANSPLLRAHSTHRHNLRRASNQSLESLAEAPEDHSEVEGTALHCHGRIFLTLLRFHTSNFGHLCVPALVAIDVVIVLAELILALLTCKAQTKTSEAVEEALSACSITISTIFVI